MYATFKIGVEGQCAMSDGTALIFVKSVHTVIWAFFVGCIVGAPVAAWLGNFALAGILVGFVALEAVVLLFNKWRCPLTDVAARYTERREENFDIYLPLWLAKYNKNIFTPLYLLGAAYSAFAWWRYS
jgi:uncharacterized membrane protein YfcA